MRNHARPRALTLPLAFAEFLETTQRLKPEAGFAGAEPHGRSTGAEQEDVDLQSVRGMDVREDRSALSFR